MNAERPAPDRRVLLLPPTRRDAEATCRLLAAAQIECTVCATIEQVCAEADVGAAAVIVAEEAVLGGAHELLAGLIQRQPVWSDLPIIILSLAGRESKTVERAVATLGNVSLIERPMGTSTLLSVVRTVLRARERQYEVRDHLKERRDSEQRLARDAMLLSEVQDSVILTDLNGIVTFWNEGATRLFGFTAADMVGRPLVERLPDESRTEAAEWIARIVAGEGGIEFRGEWLDQRKDGSPVWIEAVTRRISDADGRPVGIMGVSRDISERKRGEALLQAQNRALELVAAETPLREVLTWLARIVEEQSNQQALVSIMLVAEDGCHLTLGAAPSLPDSLNTAVDGIDIRSGLGTCCDAAAINEVVVTPDIDAAPSWHGLSHLPLQLGLKSAWSMPIRASTGKVLGTFGTYFRECREPTAQERHVVEGLSRTAALAIERRRADEALQQSEAQFRLIADAMPQIVWVTRPDGYHEYFNRQWYEFTGLDYERTKGDWWSNPLHPDDQQRARQRWKQALETGDLYETEYRIRRHDREYRWFLARALPVRDSNGQIIRWYGTCTDVHDQKLFHKQREQLLDSERSARTDAERASRMKDEFLSTLSHELRTPLNAILGWATILRSTPATQEADLLEGLDTIERNARAQTQIIDDLLDMSRIISGKVRLDVQRVDLASIVRGAIETMKPAAEAKGIRLQPVLDPSAAPVSGDPSRLQQVMWNLLSNAIKFTPRGGRVQVVLERVNSQVEVSVIDSGEGIKPQFLPHVFDRFRQADASTTRRHGGLGLGLAIVKQLVELHGGTVCAKSAGIGQGAAFTVTLPVTALRSEPHRAADERRHPVAAAVAAPVDSQLRDRIAGLKVLVVDDESDSRAVVQRLLEDCDAVVIASDSAADAVNKILTERPDVLVSDIGMPEEDGYAMIRRVRALGPTNGGNVPAVALTAYARAEDRIRAVMAGFQLHLSKPVEPSELIAMVASLAGRTGGDGEAREQVT
jgi:PAS domain S-box-containing protein